MDFVAQWHHHIDESLSQFAALAGRVENIDFTYGLMAAGVLWPIRRAVQGYDGAAADAVRAIVGEGSRGILKLVNHWRGDRIAAARSLADAAQAPEVRAALDRLIVYFAAAPTFAGHLAGVVAGRYPDRPVGDPITITEAINAALVNIGGITNIDTLTVQLNLPPAPRVAGWRPWAFGAAVLVGLAAAGLIIVEFALPFFAGPEPMTGLFNVAVADFGELADFEGVPVSRSADGEWLARDLYGELSQKIEQIPALKNVVSLSHERIGVIHGATTEERQATAGRLAAHINADVLIYGYIDTSGPEHVLAPEFYITPRLTGAEESTGPSAFGEPLPLCAGIAQNVECRNELLAQALPRLEALTEFVWGLAFLKTGNPDQAIQHFEQARDVELWRDEPGKAILYLWLGTALVERARATEGQLAASCPLNIPPPAEGQPVLPGDWACAQAVYETALRLDPSFARATIGLGYLWSSLAERTVAGTRVIDCRAYQRAIGLASRAFHEGRAAAVTSYADLRLHYNLGLTYTEAYIAGCADDFGLSETALYTEATRHLEAAVAAYQSYVERADVPLLRVLGARSFYQLGRVHLRAENYASAERAFDETIAIAEPEGAEERWQAIRWVAYNQLGYLYARRAETEGKALWERAIDSYERVIARYRDGKYDDGEVVGDAYRYSGMAYERLGDLAQARAYYGAALQVRGATPATTRFARERLAALAGS